ncbi:2-amino-4-hydroxy-6-hydroxymethyldihydropteridine diphosphokinase [Congregibacter variabilis]|uniref:2-amino-4-hydroxy-6-hydroxymethyldihydropteridine pyrophosphokinase n=1 Tax=Congregibacter variabilis TaxID=3081200 RepID=A0ABZ0HZW7_9GAMM|nr:2-amino-4-hydroxy-6-hydroxymethyldihydropteridine diphosphokinase [Congregibacter sp. IMCC43200]
MTRCFIGLGANLGNSHKTLQQAADKLENLSSTRAAGRSCIYRSAPVGPPGQPDYLNAVVALDTELPPLTLLTSLQKLEQEAGRERSVRWGPRTLDLDILIYGDAVLESERLTIPHPRLFERNFVLAPLADIVGENWRLPDGSSVAMRLKACPTNELTLSTLNWAASSSEAMSA